MGAVTKRSSKEKKAAALAPSNEPCCYGCGAPLQTAVASAAGYVAPDKYLLKQRHRQLNKVRRVPAYDYIVTCYAW
jgi:nitric-oxide synthase